MNSLADSELGQLLTFARAGNRPALGQLLDRYRPYLMLLARLQIDRRLQGKVEAADLVQETFLEAHRDFAQFRGTTEKELVGWLRQILVSNLANLVRREIAPALKRAGIPWHGWHGFRRGVGSVLYGLGVPDKVIQEVLRHANVATTQSFYIKTASAASKAAMKKLEAAFRRASK